MDEEIDWLHNSQSFGPILRLLLSVPLPLHGGDGPEQNLHPLHYPGHRIGFLQSSRLDGRLGTNDDFCV